MKKMIANMRQRWEANRPLTHRNIERLTKEALARREPEIAALEAEVQALAEEVAARS